MKATPAARNGFTRLVHGGAAHGDDAGTHLSKGHRDRLPKARIGAGDDGAFAGKVKRRGHPAHPQLVQATMSMSV